MSLREKLGLVFVAVAVILVPFGQRMSAVWALAAVVFDAVGAGLFFGHRIARKFVKTSSSLIPNAPSVHELRAFPGAGLQEDDSDRYPEIEEWD